MARFEYNSGEGNKEYYEILQQLIDRWENETVEFKEAKGQYSEDKIGQYILFDHPELDLETVYLLDQIQKGKDISDQDLQHLQEQKLIRIEDHHVWLYEKISETNRGTEMDEDRGKKDSEGENRGTNRGTEIPKGTEKGTNRGTETEKTHRKEKQLTSSEIRMMEILSNQPSISITALAAVMDLSSKGARYTLNKLREKELVIREGSQRSGKWIVLNPNTTDSQTIMSVDESKGHLTELLMK